MREPFEIEIPDMSHMIPKRITSGICLLIGSLYAFGIHAVWEQL